MTTTKQTPNVRDTENSHQVAAWLLGYEAGRTGQDVADIPGIGQIIARGCHPYTGGGYLAGVSARAGDDTMQTAHSDLAVGRAMGLLEALELLTTAKPDGVQKDDSWWETEAGQLAQQAGELICTALAQAMSAVGDATETQE